MRKIQYIIILTIGMFSCSEDKEGMRKYINKEGNYQIDYFSHQNVLIKEVVFADEFEGDDYIIKKYDSLTNLLKDSIPYVNKEINGIRKIYLDNQEKFINYHYVNGLEQGLRDGFYLDGSKYMTQNVVNDKREGEGRFYDLKGNLTSFQYCKDDGIFFLMRYDKKYIDGNPILHLVSEKSSPLTFKGKFILPNLEGFHIKLSVCKLEGEVLHSCEEIIGDNFNGFKFQTKLNSDVSEIVYPRWEIINKETGEIFEGGHIGYDLNYYKKNSDIVR